jgi:lysophospholipase L1-like esterase
MSDPSPGSARRLPLLGLLVMLVALAFTGIGLVETAFIAYDYFTHGSLSVQRAPDLSFGIRSWTLHHALRPGYHSPNVNTNALGLRSPEVTIPKRAGTFRILLLGDSFTFGLRVSDHEVFARRLEEQLRSKYGLASAEVVNAGVLSYCPMLEYLQYVHQLHGLEPDLVILNFDMSDVQDHLLYSRDAVFSADGVPLFVTEPSLGKVASAMPELLSFQWVERKFTAARNRFESRVEGVPFVRDEDRYLWALDNGMEMDREVQSTLAPIAHLSNLLQHDRIPFVLATYPQPWQVSAEATPLPPIRDQYGIGMHTVHLNDRPFRKLDAFAASHGIPFVNATGVFRKDPDPPGLYLGNDFHFSPRGHEVYAEVLAGYIVEHTPAGFRPQAVPR